MSESVEIRTRENVIEVLVTGKLTKEAYDAFGPVTEKLIESYDKIRVLFAMQDFQGWTAGALWEDLKFEYQHNSDIERLAIVGESRWQEGMSVFCKPFTSAEIKFYLHEQEDEARAWLSE